MKKNLFDLSETASLIGVDVETVKDFISCGDLAAVGSGKALVRKCDLDRFLGIDNEADISCVPIETTNKETNMVDISYGDGSVYWNKRRNCYQAAFYLTQPDGTKVRKIVSGKTTVEAIGKMEMAKAAFSRPAASAQSVYYAQTAPVVPQNVRPVIKFSVVAEEYMRMNRKSVSDTTYSGKESMLKAILPYFGDMNIDDIEYTDVQDFLDKYSVMSNGTLRSHASIKNTYTMLKSIFFYAAKKKRPYIDNAPTYGVKIPNGATSSKDDRVFTREELVNIFRACMTHNKYMTIAALALATGMRGEEFLALKWSDIDFDAKSISISQASVRQHRKDEDGGKKWERGIGQVKTKSSVRVLYC